MGHTVHETFPERVVHKSRTLCPFLLESCGKLTARAFVGADLSSKFTIVKIGAARGIDHNSAPSTSRNTRFSPMEMAGRELSNEFLKRFWGVLGAEL